MVIAPLLWWFGPAVLVVLVAIVGATAVASLTAEGWELTRRAILLSFVFLLFLFFLTMVVN